MSDVKKLTERLRGEVRSARSSAIFRAAVERQPSFSAFEDVAALLAALADTRDSTYPERDALTRALLAEHASSKASLWSSILVIAYYPMLSRLRHRIIGDAISPDDLDQLVLIAFMTAVNELSACPPPDRTAMRLRQRTERQVFAAIRRERAEQHLPLDLDDLVPSPDAEQLGLQDNVAEHDRVAFAAAELVERAARTVSAGGLNLVVATLLQREPLRAYVSRCFPIEDARRERAYQRLKRQRTRALQRLRAMASESPDGSIGTLLP